MCGIFAYINYKVKRSTREILTVLLDGLQRVEYRGYDSAGLCVDNYNIQQPPIVIRSVGNIAQLREVVFNNSNNNNNNNNNNELEFENIFETHVGIAHTRWATHGAPSVLNSHPQVSNNKQFVIVHNGIMTNFTPVKEMLLNKGYYFNSDTDTEVIAVLAEFLMKEEPKLSFVELAIKIKTIVEGAYALLIKSTHFPNELIACRMSSPLMVGIRRGESCNNNNNNNNNNKTNTEEQCEVYFASDVNSFMSYTREVISLENNDIAHFHNGKINFYTTCVDKSTIQVSRTSHTIEHELEGLNKDGYEHFMLKEIYEQPDSVTRSMRGRIDFQTEKIKIDSIDIKTIESIRKANRIILISCGTSYHSCLAVRPIFEQLLPHISITVENAPDFMDRLPQINSNDICIFVSQSGETADTLMALQHCKEGNAKLIGLTNVAGSSVLRQTNNYILLNAGVEVGVASTKAYTSQIVVLTLLALLITQNINNNNINNNSENEKEINAKIQKRRSEIIHGLSILPGVIAQCLSNINNKIQSLAETLEDSKTILILGRGYDYATALESALKVKEVSYVYTEGIHSGELKHGPLALIDNNSNVIAFCANDKHLDRSKSALQQVKARGGRVIAITNKIKDSEIIGATISTVEVPEVVDCLQGIVNVIPLQLLAYYLALRRGHNVDCPRNLAKSVTVQ